MFDVEVIYALPNFQYYRKVQSDGTLSALELVRLSGFIKRFKLDEEALQLGSFSRKLKCHDVVKKGQRIEIYRPLTDDPKEIRKRKLRN